VIAVLLDKRRLERIVVNLLDNARNHADGPARIALEDGTRNTLRLVVEDSGPGVPPNERDHIFERFYRGTEARRRVGTGLGLALVSEHATAMGGRAWVEDRRGGGARFVVSLPAVRA
jgi:signal transduction histidine kinase